MLRWKKFALLKGSSIKVYFHFYNLDKTLIESSNFYWKDFSL